MNTRQASKNEAGAVIVESAFILLGFLVLLLGIMEAGRIMNVHQVMTDAAREGARLAVTPLTGTSTLASDAAIQAEVQRFLNAASISGATISITRPTQVLGGTQTTFTRVVVTAPYRIITLSMFSSLRMTLEGESSMRNETSP